MLYRRPAELSGVLCLTQISICCGKTKAIAAIFLIWQKHLYKTCVINRVWNPLGISFGCEETKWIAAFVILCFRACVPIFDEASFCPCFLSLQMHHPIQMKPADSEKSNGEWHCTHAQRQTHQYHIHTYTCMHASIAFFEFCLVMAISAWLADSAGDSGKRLKHRAEERKGWDGAILIYINIFLYVWWIIKVVHKEVSESWIVLASLWTGLSPLWLLTHTNMLYALSSCHTRSP